MAFKLLKVLAHTTAVSGLPVLVDQAILLAKTGYDLVVSDGVRNRYVATPPIGFVYTRYPGQTDPATLFPGTTWQAQYYAGAFFRSETSGGGGPEIAFNGAMQTAQNLSHSHGSPITSGAGSSHAHAVGSLVTGGQSVTHKHEVPSQGSTLFGTSGWYAGGGLQYLTNMTTGAAELTNNANADHTHAISGSVGAEASHTHTVTVASDGGSDLRPINYTIQIYKRTA